MAEHLPTKLVMFGAMALLGLPVQAAPPPAPDGAAQLRVDLAIDASLLESSVAARLEPEIAKQLEPVLERADLDVVSSPRVGEQRLSVRVTAFDEERRNYEVDLQLGNAGGVMTLVTATCDACNERRLIAALVEEVPRLVELHRGNCNKCGALSDVGESGVGSSDPERLGDSPEMHAKRMSALGGVGIGVAVLGVGALVAGGVELRRGKVYDDVQPTDGVRTFLDHGPPGVAMLGAGAVVLAGGVTMLVIDLIRMKQRRAGHLAGRVYPRWDDHSVGLEFSLRF